MKKSDFNNIVLFFETYSVLQIFCLFKYIRKARLIYFHNRSFPPLKYNQRMKMIAERLIGLFNRHLKIEALPVEKINEHNWMMNKKSVGFVEGLTADIKSSSIYKAMLGIIRDENILKCYKAQLVNDVSARLLFFRIAKDLIETYKDDIYLICADNDNSRIQKELFGNEVLNSYILPEGFVANQIGGLFNKVYNLVIFLLLPSVYIVLNLKKITWKRINKKRYDIAMPFIWGFHNGEPIIDGIRCAQDDSYLYNKKITPGCIIHIFKHWRYSDEMERRHKNIMAKRNIPYIDSADYKINAHLLIITAKIQLKIFKNFLLKAFFLYDRNKYLRYSNNIIYQMLKKYHEFENIDYQVEFIKHDYNSAHIVETILCNQHNKKTVGIQHHASPYDLPILSYVHFDKYIIFSQMDIEEFFPYWEGLNLAKTGRETVDFAVNILNDKGAIFRLKERFRRLYPERKYMVVIVMSGDVELNPKSQWDEMYRALYRLKSLDTIDFNLFLRFRSINYLYGSENMIRFAKLPLWDKRIIIDHINFSTYELMALCDVLIACNVSFSINEALARGVKVFTFNLHEKAKYLFRDYGNDFILNTAEDILRVFNGLKNNFKDFNCNWELLKRHCNFHNDGRNLERIQGVVLETLAETQKKEGEKCKSVLDV